MAKRVPTYSLNNLSKEKSSDTNVFILNDKVDSPQYAVNVPFRSNYFGIGICISGSAILKVNLETYIVEPGDLVVLSPQIIRQFVLRSEDYRSISIFFTKEFITSKNNLNTGDFLFFENTADHVLKLSQVQKDLITNSINFLKIKYDLPHPHRLEILRYAINILVYDVSSIYSEQNLARTSTQTRGQVLTQEFKGLVNRHFLIHRNVQFYADQLSITRKHLSECIKDSTGKTAGEWIVETIILEAKVLLQDPALTISQIADILSFPDQSTFGKYFKNNTSQSPGTYRQGL